jgi:hypothetical protein
LRNIAACARSPSSSPPLRDVGAAGTGQIASAGASLRALSGPLADIHVKGVFATDDAGETRFTLDSDVGPIDCGPME